MRRTCAGDMPSTSRSGSPKPRPRGRLTPTQQWIAHYQADVDNLRGALEWAFGPDGDVAVGLELVGSSHVLWAELGLMLEHRRWVLRRSTKSARQRRGRSPPGCSLGRQATCGRSMIPPTMMRQCGPRPSTASSATAFTRGARCCAQAWHAFCRTAAKAANACCAGRTRSCARSARPRRWPGALARAPQPACSRAIWRKHGCCTQRRSGFIMSWAKARIATP